MLFFFNCNKEYRLLIFLNFHREYFFCVEEVSSVEILFFSFRWFFSLNTLGDWLNGRSMCSQRDKIRRLKYESIFWKKKKAMCVYTEETDAYTHAHLRLRNHNSVHVNFLVDINNDIKSIVSHWISVRPYS